MKTKRHKKRWTIFLLLLASVLILALYPTPQQAPIRFADRESSLINTEKVAGEKWLVWLYNNPMGEATLWSLVKRKGVSSIYGKMMESPGSVKKIQPFVEEFAIDLSIAQKQHFSSFNDFFTRKLKKNVRPLDTTSTVLVSPSDGKILAWADISITDFLIKGYRFNVTSFLNNPGMAEKYMNGSMIVIRLAPNDYHRFHFPVSGHIMAVDKIDGDYYSVNPMALRKMAEIFCLNKREYTIISSPIYGELVMVEVGATMVGSIVQTYTGNHAIKGAEKGYFKFGGSTVILLFKKGRISIDQDLLNNTMVGLETKIKMGERIGIGVLNSQVSLFYPD